MFYFKAPKPKQGTWTVKLYESLHLQFQEFFGKINGFFSTKPCELLLAFKLDYHKDRPMIGEGTIETFDGASIKAALTMPRSDFHTHVSQLNFLIKI